MTYIAGVDIGGTFTDCALIDESGRIVTGKAPTTPSDRSQGFIASLASAAERGGISLDELYAGCERLLHGTTVATNAMVERNGAKVGVITTRGHRDNLMMMRGTGRVVGMPLAHMLDLPATNKPDPLVPRRLIREVNERVDFSGEVIVPLDRSQAREEIEFLVSEGVEAICVSFLWSFENPTHEQEVAALIEEVAEGLFVTAAHEIIGKWGEYERTVGGVINSYVGPSTKKYLERVAAELASGGYSSSFFVMQSTGGLATAEEASRSPLLTVGSGPVGGLEGVRFLARQLDLPNVIGADVGGTTFDVGLIVDGEMTKSLTTSIDQYQYSVPVVDIQSIGSGGGSIAWVDEIGGAMRVGPHSAGADPGPACYGRGGTEATVTDAALVLGYLDPGFFLGGGLNLDRDSALTAVGKIADRLDMGLDEAASGILTIAEFHMADLIRRMTVQRGIDARDFAMVAHGGAGALHAGVIARELGVKKIVVPLGDAAGAWSALGCASSNILRVFERTQVMYEPFDPDALSRGFGNLEERARSELEGLGFSSDDIELRRFASMQYGYQVHQVDVPVREGDLSEAGVTTLVADFEALYGRLFGEGTGYRAAGVKIIDLRLEAVGVTAKPVLRQDSGHKNPTASAERDIYWPNARKRLPTPVYLGTDLGPGSTISGPTVIEYDFTTIVVHPGQDVSVDQIGNTVIDVFAEERQGT